MEFSESWFEDEVRDGFYIPALLKRCRAAELEMLDQLAAFWKNHGIRWFAAGDLLLGAALCHGFLPWGDRITVSMCAAELQRFTEVADELPDGLMLDGNQVVNGEKIDWSEEFLTRYHGFPYVGRIEILTEDAAGDRMTCGAPQNHGPEEIFMAFENMQVPVPADYDAVLKSQYGEHPGEAGRLPAGEHPGVAVRMPAGDYPFYMEQEHQYNQETNMISRCFYQFHRDDLRKPSHDDEETVVDSFLEAFTEAHRKVLCSVQMTNTEEIIRSFTKAQDIAVKFGNFIEVNFPESAIVVIPMLEAYCNRLYQLGEALKAENASTQDTAGGGSSEPQAADDRKSEPQAADGTASVQMAAPEDCLEACMKFASAVEAAVTNEILEKREIVFLPFKASGWRNLEPLYRYYKSRQDCRVCVVPVPYYHITDKNTYGEKVYEGDDFPDDVETISYETFNLYTHKPDSIITQCPYDQYGMGMRLSADLYAGELQKFTKHLIYVPWFSMNEISADDRAAAAMADYYILQPGVTMADIVLVQSPKMRKFYIDRLSERCGEQTRPIWEKKIQTIEGSVVL